MEWVICSTTSLMDGKVVHGRITRLQCCDGSYGPHGRSLGLSFMLGTPQREDPLPSPDTPSFFISSKLQVLLHRSVPVGAVFSLETLKSPLVPDLIGRKVADERLSFFDQMDCTLIHCVKVVRRKKQPILNSAPSHFTSFTTDSTYSVFSFVGFVSSKRRLNFPPYSFASPEFRMDSHVRCGDIRWAPVGISSGHGHIRPPPGLYPFPVQ